MKARFGEIKEFKTCYGAPPVGNYALETGDDKNVKWDHCREQFAAKFNELTPGFFFSHPSGKGQDIAEFVTKFEAITFSRMRKPHDYSSFSKTTKETILWVAPTPFWLNCLMKRSLLTIILRCGINYVADTDNFDDALFGDYKESVYAKETRSATLRFMFGFTNFTGSPQNVGSYSSVVKHGWREEFQKLDDCTIRRRLALPDGEVREASIIGVESLWT